MCLEKLIELPVAEEMQLGISNGLAINGFIPISIFLDGILLLATNQLVSHLDKFEVMSQGKYKPKVIIRTSIGSQRPLHPQHQHIGDLHLHLKNFEKVEIIRLEKSSKIIPSYRKALNRKDGKRLFLLNMETTTKKNK